MPKDPEIEALIGQPVPVDLGLGAFNEGENGKFTVSSLRNLTRTPPYGHNGFFKTIREIVHFYNTRDCGVPGVVCRAPGVEDAGWPAPEVAENVTVDELGNLGLTEQEEDDIVALLKTLTDGYSCRNCD